MEEETPADANLEMRIEQHKIRAAAALVACGEANAQREDGYLRLEALRLAIGQGGSDAIIREKAETFLAFLKGEPAPEKAGE